jgi:hypothetical protein
VTQDGASAANLLPSGILLSIQLTGHTTKKKTLCKMPPPRRTIHTPRTLWTQANFYHYNLQATLSKMPSRHRTIHTPSNLWKKRFSIQLNFRSQHVPTPFKLVLAPLNQVGILEIAGSSRHHQVATTSRRLRLTTWQPLTIHGLLSKAAEQKMQPPACRVPVQKRCM